MHPFLDGPPLFTPYHTYNRLISVESSVSVCAIESIMLHCLSNCSAVAETCVTESATWASAFWETFFASGRKVSPHRITIESVHSGMITARTRSTIIQSLHEVAKLR